MSKPNYEKERGLLMQVNQQDHQVQLINKKE
jgi:hypothetical protein